MLSEKKYKKLFMLTVVIVALGGFLLGIVGELFIQVYLFEFPVNLPFFKQLDFTQKFLLPDNLIIEAPENVIVQQDLQITQALSGISPSLVNIHLKKRAAQDIWQEIYLAGESLGRGTILTSDGWVLTTNTVIKDVEKEYLVTNDSRELFTVSKIVVDPATEAVFLKLEHKLTDRGELEVENLSVVKLGFSEKLILGEIVLVGNTEEQVVVTSIQDLAYQFLNNPLDIFQSSENFFQYILIRDQLDGSFEGSVLVNLAGEVVGIVNHQEGINLIIPLYYLTPAISSVLSEGQIKRPYLGVNYIDLSQVAGVDKSISYGLDKGALIYQSSGRPAVVFDSPAELAGLKSRDIILEVDGEKVDQKNSLTELIQEYQTGDKIKITFLREGEEEEMEVTLK